MKRIAVAMALLALAGCEDRIRYFCQHWDNWGLERCQKPRCQATQDCPEYLIDLEAKK